MANYDFTKIPLWSGDSSSFDVLADEISGRIPATRLERWQDFSDLLESEFFNRPKTQWIFRGHRRYDWGLMPTLARVTQSEVIDRPLAASQLEHFRHAVRGRLADSSLVSATEEDELWSVGQHHGLMTPLLDWTHSPYVALFFAFYQEDPDVEEDNPYRAVYVLNKSFIADDDLCPDIRLFEPRKDDHGRLVNQAGLFTFSPYDSTIENTSTNTLASEEFGDGELRNAAEDEQAGIIARYICKIYIKNEDHESCMRHLRRMNVHHASLFPDLIGAAAYCNAIIAEERLEYEIEHSHLYSSEKDSTPANHYVTEKSGEYDATRVDDHPELNGSADDHTQAFAPGDGNTERAIATLLRTQTGNQVEPGRIQLIANKISRNLAKLKTVDWDKREKIQSQMRSSMRITLRKLEYPVGERDTAIDAIMDAMLYRQSEDELDHA